MFKKSLETFAEKGLPDALRLLAAYVRANAEQFRVPSEEGDWTQRVAATTVLALACVAGIGFSASIVYVLAPTKIEFMPAQGVILAAFATLIGGLGFSILRLFDKRITASYFVNVGLAAAVLLAIGPPLLMTLGTYASPRFHFDYDRLRAGHGGETGLHDFYCGTLERRALLAQDMIELTENTQRQVVYQRLMTGLNSEIMANIAETQRLTPEFLARARAPGAPANDPWVTRTAQEQIERSLDLAERSHALRQQGMPLIVQGLEIMERGDGLQKSISDAPLILARAYPVLTAFVVAGALTGLLVWIQAARLVWRRMVLGERSRLRRIGIGALVAALLVGILSADLVVASGLLDVSVGREPSTREVIAELQYEFRVAEPFCGKIANHAAW